VSKEEVVQRGYRITGRVQGVFFRVWTRDTAQGMGLDGTVKNRPDGSVEAHVVGQAAVVEEFQAGLWEGPPASRVDNVEVIGSEEDLESGVFEILY